MSPAHTIQLGGVVPKLTPLPSGHFVLQQSVLGIYTVVYSEAAIDRSISNRLARRPAGTDSMGLGAITVNLKVGLAFLAINPNENV